VGLVNAPPAAAELVGRIGWLIRLRWIAVVGVAAFLAVTYRVFPVRLPLLALYSVLAALAACNLAYSLVFRRWRRVEGATVVWVGEGLRRFLVPREERGLGGEIVQAALFANTQILLDLVLLAALLHFGGGIENPFRFFFVFHVIIAAMLLSRAATYLHATLGLLLVSAVAIAEAGGALTHYTLEGSWAPEAYRAPLPVGDRLFVLGTTLYLAAYMGSAIGSRLRARERDAARLSDALAEKARALEAANESLRRIERSKSQYMRKVSHELRGPLGTIQTAVKVVLGGEGALAPSSRDLLDRAGRRAGELAQLVQDLLHLARAREASLPAARAPVHLDAILTDVVRETEPAARKAGVKVSLTIGPGVAEIEGDPAGLQQLVGNLLENALRYTPRGGEVRMGLERAADGLRLVVEDTGIGIPRADLPHVFDEFFRSANARERVADGTGLGLAVVKAVAEQHAGTVVVDSEPGRGTRFTVELPFTEPPPGDQATTQRR
jgi:signal transduction histidine kinase